MSISRRNFFAFFAGTALGASLFPVKLWGEMDKQDFKITKEMIRHTEKLCGLEFTNKERQQMITSLKNYLETYQKINAIEIPYNTPPAWKFHNNYTTKTQSGKTVSSSEVQVPEKLDDIAFCSLRQLAKMLREKRITSVEMTRFFLQRLKKYNETLQCVITLTEELALKEAEKADEEIKEGIDRGILHGIPYGIKDLFATKNYRTTWGGKPYENQVIDEDAFVVTRLRDKGAILLAKLTTGALAMGDVWFGGTTKNPWDLKVGSSGSSAGPASAVSAGLVPFAIGTETWGSIVSPCTRCGVTGLRPTFGRVSRYGCMPLSWTMDKIGPIARSVDDCAIVFSCIHGEDLRDQTVDAPFNWQYEIIPSKTRIGFVASAFDRKSYNGWKKADIETLSVLEKLGFELVPINLPSYDIEGLEIILKAEAAASFDSLTKSNRDDILVQQNENSWPNIFRSSQLIPAVEYIRANRIRTLLVHEMNKIMNDIDVYVCPTYGENNLLLTNLTGHPSVVVPNGVTHKGKYSITFVGNLFEDDKLAGVSHAYQGATTFHLQNPKLF